MKNIKNIWLILLSFSTITTLASSQSQSYDSQKTTLSDEENIGAMILASLGTPTSHKKHPSSAISYYSNLDQDQQDTQIHDRHHESQKFENSTFTQQPAKKARVNDPELKMNRTSANKDLSQLAQEIPSTPYSAASDSLSTQEAPLTLYNPSSCTLRRCEEMPRNQFGYSYFEDNYDTK